MMHCKTLQTWLVEYADDALDAPRHAKMEEHLSGCPACTALARELSETRRMLRGISPVQTSAHFEARLVARLDEARRAKAARFWWSGLSPKTNLLRPALALGAAVCAIAGVAVIHTDVPASPPAVSSDDAALITQCVALHQRDVAAQPLTDAAATGVGRNGWTGDATANAAQEDNL